jgi:hypothetical protein
MGQPSASGMWYAPHTMQLPRDSHVIPWCFMMAGGLLAALAAGAGGWLARGSTAVPAAIWAVCAACAVSIDAGLHAAGWVMNPPRAASLRLCVTALLVCPAMSLLGAKRPQHGIWQVIVASLAVVLILPAASAEFVRPGSPPAVHILVRCFLALLAAIGWMNAVGTGRRVPATLVTAGGLILMRGFLPGMETERSSDSPWLDASAAWLLGGGGMLAVMYRQRHQGSSRVLHGEIEQPYLSLRETLGLAWTLRIAERFNGLAESRGWPCRLRSDGLETDGDSLDRSWHGNAIRTFESIMRRFVSHDWLARHRGDETQPSSSVAGGAGDG